MSQKKPRTLDANCKKKKLKSGHQFMCFPRKRLISYFYIQLNSHLFFFANCSFPLSRNFIPNMRRQTPMPPDICTHLNTSTLAEGPAFPTGRTSPPRRSIPNRNLIVNLHWYWATWQTLVYTMFDNNATIEIILTCKMPYLKKSNATTCPPTPQE